MYNDTLNFAKYVGAINKTPVCHMGDTHRGHELMWNRLLEQDASHKYGKAK